jgi:hypothetical protein
LTSLFARDVSVVARPSVAAFVAPFKDGGPSASAPCVP